MVAKDTVEERIFALQERKRAIADVALGEADHAGGSRREELLALLDSAGSLLRSTGRRARVTRTPALPEETR